MRVIHRCRQIVPSLNHLYMRPITSSGVEKKNGGTSGLPSTGIVVSKCHAISAIKRDEQLEQDEIDPAHAAAPACA